MSNRIEFKSAGLLPPQAFGRAFPYSTAAEVAAIHQGLVGKGFHQLAAYLVASYAENAPTAAHVAEFNRLIEVEAGQ